MVTVNPTPVPRKRREQKREETDIKLGRLQHASEEEYTQRLAQKWSLPYIDLFLFPTPRERGSLLKEVDAKKHNAAIVQKRGKQVRIATSKPQNSELITFLHSLEEQYGWAITLFVCSMSSLKKAWQVYDTVTLIDTLEKDVLEIDKEQLKSFDKDLKRLVELKKNIDEVSTTEVLEIITAGAIAMDASDIHFEPQEESFRLRYRIDGILQDITRLPLHSYKPILTRVKILAGLKINIRDIAQDGRFNIDSDQNPIDVRVSVIPGNNGEAIVMRLLNPNSILLSLDDLGVGPHITKTLQKHIQKPNGIILNTGPTGSGKTTTLYAILRALNSPDKKIITIEDPIEYEIEGISQTQVERKKGYTFAKGLRAIVRQDPDVILVGEIRDDETADITINAGLTGHLVLSTLHTNNAAGTIPRLIELGVKPHLLIDGLNLVMAQRLVRRLCDHCKQEYSPAPQSAQFMKEILAVISPKAKVNVPKDITVLYRSVGCAKCNGTGYKGRVAIFEFIEMTEALQSMILNLESEENLTKQAIEDGMITMTQDGILKVLHGITSMDEVWRTTEQSELLQEMYDHLMEQTIGRAIAVSLNTQKELKKAKTIQNMKEIIDQTDTEYLLETILGTGFHWNASDIHIEPQKTEVSIRVRIDGALQTVGSAPLTSYPTILGNIKLLCGLEAKTRAGTKDGRFTVHKEREDGTIQSIDVRTSIILGGYGETVVMRLLSQDKMEFTLESLGFNPWNLKRILRAIEKPNGMILDTGPTGSGKSTTLYAILKILNKPENKIITVEDPIEYQIDGILQTQIDKENGYNFDTAIRTLVRQDPDIMMIGEIRDETTAQTALQAALSGHLILSTLHTNDAVSSVQRLMSLGADPDLISTATNAFVAQRLIRKLCPSCAKRRTPTQDEKKYIQRTLSNLSPKTGYSIPTSFYIFDPVGCQKCGGLGYAGQTIVSEVLLVDEQIQELIASSALSKHIYHKAIEAGMLTMAQDGVLKVLEGITSLDEVKRVT